VWWRLLVQNKKKMQRVASIIGNYNSNQHDQAEFRNSAQAEEQRLKLIGVRLL
jgi:hypothetical protein